MIIKPKAKRFRIQRAGSVQAQPTAPTQAARPMRIKRNRPAVAQGGLNPLQAAAAEAVEDGFPDTGFKNARGGAVESPAEVDADAEIEAIKKEGLTGRELRTARRTAKRHSIAALSDFDAVRKLRKAGIDPFKRSTNLGIVPNENGTGGEKIQLPQTIERAKLPAHPATPEESAAKSILEIQQDIARRRRQRMIMLSIRLLFFIVIPTILAGIYYNKIATPMYATNSQFVIQKNDGGGGGGAGGLASAFAGTGFANATDSTTVQNYLTSRDAMQRLDKDLGYKSHFSQDWIDPIQRLSAEATNEEAYKLFKKNVIIGFDPTEGMIKMEVVAATPEASGAFSNALIRYAEERVDNLTQRLREDQMKGALQNYEEAEAEMLSAQDEVLRLQEGMGVFDPTSDAAALMSQITTFETELQRKSLALQQLLDNRRPNQARVEGMKSDIARLDDLVQQLRQKLTQASGENGSLASITGRLQIAQTNLQTRTMLMQQSLQQLESARIAAHKQTRYLERSVNPVAPDEPTYPRAFESTMLAFLIFSGIYLMISLTVSILREQVSS